MFDTLGFALNHGSICDGCGLPWQGIQYEPAPPFGDIGLSPVSGSCISGPDCLRSVFAQWSRPAPVFPGLGVRQSGRLKPCLSAAEMDTCKCYHADEAENKKSILFRLIGSH